MNLAIMINPDGEVEFRYENDIMVPVRLRRRYSCH